MLHACAHRFAGFAFGLAAALAALFLTATAALAGHSTGHTLYVGKGCAGCHGDPPGAPRHNAADAAQVITAAINNNAATGMGFLDGSVSAGERSDIAAYLETVFNTTPISRGVTFNTATVHSLAAYITTGTAATGLTLATVSAPAKGSVGYAGSSFTYTPTACQVGSDSFTYRGQNGGLVTNTRTVDITIGNPTTPPTISTAAPPGGQTGVAYSHDVNVAACNSLVTFSVSSGSLPTGLSINSSSGLISGTPSATGTFNGTIRATYPGGQFDSQAFSITISLGPPDITSAGTAASGAVGVAYPGYTITATNGPNTFGASGLPPGLAVNASTGAITGTPTDAAGSPYVATVTASNGVPPNDSQNVTFNIVPAINSAPSASGQSGVAFSYQVTKTAGPAFTGYAALDPLPAGLSLNTSSGLISGTPTTVGGPTNVRLTGANAFGTSAQFTLAITITLGPPVITSSLNAAAGATLPFNYQITATNPPHTGFNATGLPAGLSVNTSTGAISGSPSPGTGGVHMVTISATNATGTGQATLTLTVSENPPVITSAGTASGTTGVAFIYQITANNGVTSFGASGLPPGVTANAATGLISGTPTAAGTFNATMTATNGSGSDSDPLVITIALGPPAITSATTAGGAEGFPFSYQITATNPPHTAFGATGLPPGLSVNTSSGLISGTPTASGTFNVAISATNATATATQGLVITLGIGIPVITSAGTASGGTGAAFIYQVTATNNPTSYGATGLPPGLSINPATGLITGAPGAAGTFSANLSAANATGTGTRSLTVTVSQLPPTIVTGTPATGVAGVPFSYTIQAGNGATGFAATGLPPGLTLDPNSGIISGTPTAGGTYAVTIGVTNSAGTTTFTLTIIVAFPLATVADASVDVQFETATSITLPVSGQNFTVNIVTLPEHGLANVQPGGRVVTYTPANGYVGADSFAYTATNPAGTTAAATVRITVVPVPPTSRAAAMTVPLNTPTTLNLAAFVKGAGLTGVAVRTVPRHGTVAVNGLNVTYTPRTDFFGTDTFTYVAFGTLGSSQPATVTVSVTGRPDPTRDPNVGGLVEAQSQAARRFAGAQIGNIQSRMESLHRPEPAPVPPPQPEGAPSQTGAVGGEPVRLAAATMPNRGTDAGPLNLASTMAQVVTTGTLPVNGSTTLRGGTTIWISGSASFGTIDGNDDRRAARFDTDGVSLGADRRLGERFAAGLAAGFARDESRVGEGPTRSKARGASIAAYGSFQAGPRTYIDALLGYGTLRLDSRRHVTAVDEIATARREGRQVFGSVSAGYEWVRENVLVSPYGRVDFSADRLDAVSESGAGAYALRFGEQAQRSGQGAAGVRAEAKHETDFGWSVPRARAEYRREFGGDRRQTLTYADLLGGTEYAITPAGTSRNSFLLGLGADLVFRGGLRFGFDYTAQRSSGAANVQGVRLFVSQDLDAPASAWRFEPLLLKSPVNVDLSYTYDDNVNRGREDLEKRRDNIFSASANQSWSWILRERFRAQVTWLASGEKFDRHAGLGRLSLGGQGEMQYRASGAFNATTFALVGRAHYERHESYYRTGPRYYLGLNARNAVTDRIELFGEIGTNVRRGRSEVFQWRDVAAKFNADYALGRKGTLYLTGEYRRGDTVSTGFASLANVGVAEVFVPDDAMAPDFLSYRFDARTVLGTVGVNYPLGTRDSIDLSWRRVEATPRKRPSFDFAGPLKYVDNQYSLVYLMRF